MADEKNFLSRWSQRKLERAREEEGDGDALGEAPAEEVAALESVPRTADEALPDGAEPEPHPTEAIDIDALTKESDFTVFMEKGVPPAVKRRALRKLWTSDPVLANLDGLNDYEDMERVYGIGPIGATAWKVGRGFLTDEDLGLTVKETDEEEASGEAPEVDTEPAQTAAAEVEVLPEAEEEPPAEQMQTADTTAADPTAEKLENAPPPGASEDGERQG